MERPPGECNPGRVSLSPCPLLSQAACGLPDTFSGRAYPVLDCAVFECGRRASADWGRGLRAPSPCPYPQGDNPSGAALTLRVQGSRENGFELFTAERKLEARAARKETGI